jgi:hypothetical protein
MIEIENLTKACGLSAFRYWVFPPPRFDNVAEPQIPPEPVRAPDPAALQAPPATFAPGPARAESRVEPARPMPVSVLGEVAAVLNPAASDPSPLAPTARSTRSARTARSAWRAAASPPHSR